MKPTRLIPLFLTVLLALACQPDEKEIVFPDTQTLEVSAGDTLSVTFDAPVDWRLSSSQTWCAFLQDGETLYSISGQAGTQTLSLLVGDEGLTQDKTSTARITLYMQDKEGILAEITRRAAVYEAKLFDADGQAITELTVGYDRYVEFQVEANFTLTATGLPAWAELRDGSFTALANRRSTGALRFVADGQSEKYEQQGRLTLVDMDGKVSIPVPLVFAGMDPHLVLLDQPGGNPWNWSLSANGRSWTRETERYEDYVTASVTAYHDDYEVLMVSDDRGQWQIQGIDWLHYDRESGRLSADSIETDTDRSAYVLAFPRALYDTLQAGLPNSLFETENGQTTIAYRYLQNNLLIHVTQSAGQDGPDTGEVGFKAICFTLDWELLEIDCRKALDDERLNRCESLFGTRELFVLDTPSPRGHFDQVRPWPLLQNPDDLNGDCVYFADAQGVRMENETPELSYSDSENPPYWYIMQCRNSETPVYLLLLNPQNMSVSKVLLIHTSAQ